jgi:hypothetical protein
VFHTNEVITQKPLSSCNNNYYRPERKAKEHIAILSLSTFLAFFSNPESLAEVLLARGNAVVRAWNEQNSHPRMQGKRRPLTVTWILAEYEWKNSKGKIEKSQYTLQINTFMFTNNNQQTKRPIITLKDLKVSLPPPPPAANAERMLLAPFLFRPCSSCDPPPPERDPRLEATS